MVNELYFISNEKGKYSVEFISKGTSTIQINRAKSGLLIIYAFLDGLNPIPIFKFTSDSPKDIIFQLNIQNGVNVLIESESEVKDSSVLVDE